MELILGLLIGLLVAGYPAHRGWSRVEALEAENDVLAADNDALDEECQRLARALSRRHPSQRHLRSVDGGAR